jgi:hypothetical protein
MVADYYKIDADIVYNWTMPHFSDRQEYMFIQMELQKPPVVNKPGEMPLSPGEQVYRGPNRG